MADYTTFGTDSLTFARIQQNGIPVFRVTSGKDTAKTATFVAKMLEVQNKGISDTFFKRDYTPLYREDLISLQTRAIVDAYQRFAPGLSSETVVIGPAHRLGVYLARVLNAPFLPIQFLTYFKDWKEVIQPPPECTAIAGCDFDADPLHYMWVKPHHIPPAYESLLREAKNIVLYRAIDFWNAKKHKTLFLHPSAYTRDTTNNPFLAPLPLWSDFETEKMIIRDWEFGLPDETIAGIKRYAQLHGKKLFLVEGEAAILKRAITPFVIDFYAKNKVRPLRMSFNSYSIAHPYYEIESLCVPRCFYQLDTPDNREFIGKIQMSTGITHAELCLNQIGGDSLEAIEQYLIQAGYFNLDLFAKGVDRWDDLESASRKRAAKLPLDSQRKWNFLTVDDLARSASRITEERAFYPSLRYEYT